MALTAAGKAGQASSPSEPCQVYGPNSYPNTQGADTRPTESDQSPASHFPVASQMALEFNKALCHLSVVGDILLICFCLWDQSLAGRSPTAVCQTASLFCFSCMLEVPLKLTSDFRV